MRHPLLAITSALLLGACTVGPVYVRPPLDVPAAWRVDYPTAARIANTEWWKQFGDPVLDQLIDTALHENRDVRVAAARVDQFAGVLISTRSQLNPQLGYGANASIGAGLPNCWTKTGTRPPFTNAFAREM